MSSVPARDLNARLLKNASLVLGIVNVLQPVALDSLEAELGSGNPEDLRDALKFLKDRGWIKELPNSRYRTTWKGQSSMWSQTLQIERDVQRLWFLSNYSDRRRSGGEEGDHSQ